MLEDKQDIEIPQGTAQAVDRVMFPLPVGDIVQTLQSDRERRFTNLLRAIFSSGLAEPLQGKNFLFLNVLINFTLNDYFLDENMQQHTHLFRNLNPSILLYK